MKSEVATLSVRPIEWRGGALWLLDQRLLPGREKRLKYTEVSGVARAIRTMVVRGAPAIGVTAAFGLVLAVKAAARKGRPWKKVFAAAAAELGATRPTAVNLFWAIERMRRTAQALDGDGPAALARLEAEAVAIREEDVRANREMGRHGARLLSSGDSVLTHCNAGALATAGYGTALGVVRAAVEAGKKIHVFVDETRPVLQGARLTAWELVRDGIPCTLITDNMAASLMRAGRIQAAIVGADRIAGNGDVANKIGTYGVAVLCRAHRVPFYVAAPRSTIDPGIRRGRDIPIEERDGREVTHPGGRRIAPEGIPVCNPSFDVTPARLVTAIVTEKGVLRAPFPAAIRKLFP
jgi:methylthioribose-1-phosphate isomerase